MNQNPGYRWAENVDKLIRKRPSIPFEGPEISMAILRQMGRTMNREWVRKKHIGTWREKVDSRQSKIYLNRPDDRRSR